MNARPTIYVVDDDDSLRTSTAELLREFGFGVQEYASAGEFFIAPPNDGPGCVLLDVRLPGPSGLDLHTAMQRHDIRLPVIFLTGYADVPSSVRAMKAGAIDFLEKPVTREALMDAIGRALERDRALRAAHDESDRHRARIAALTSREREVFDRIVAGKINKEIAHELGVALRTVKAYRAQLMAKMGVGSAAELGRIAGENEDSD